MKLAQIPLNVPGFAVISGFSEESGSGVVPMLVKVTPSMENGKRRLNVSSVYTGVTRRALEAVEFYETSEKAISEYTMATRFELNRQKAVLFGAVAAPAPEKQKQAEPDLSSIAVKPDYPDGTYSTFAVSKILVPKDQQGLHHAYWRTKFRPTGEEVLMRAYKSKSNWLCTQICFRDSKPGKRTGDPFHTSERITVADAREARWTLVVPQDWQSIVYQHKET